MTTEYTTHVVRADRSSDPGGTWDLAPLDLACMPLVLRGTWVFDTKLDTEVLRHGLSQLLCHYPHLGGRIAERVVLRLVNEGVPFSVEARPELRRDSFRADGTLAASLAAPYSLHGVRRGRSAPLSVKLTELCDGSVLSVSCTHGCLDGHSFYAMVRDWALLCRGWPIDEPVANQLVLPSPDSRTRSEVREDAIRLGWSSISPWSLVRLAFFTLSNQHILRTRPAYFCSTALADLKHQLVSGDMGTLTTHTALSAALAKICSTLLDHAADTPCSMVSVVDLRERVACLPARFVGNGSGSVLFPIGASGASAQEIASAVTAGLASARQRPSSALTKAFGLALEIAYHRLRYANFNFADLYKRKPTLYYVNSFARFPVYDADFGSGRPCLVVPHNIGDPVFIWPAPPDKGGLEVYFSGALARDFAERGSERVNSVLSEWGAVTI
ncbi:MAG: acyltransferase [Myxococcales bacterium]|nr:acyltransferase [Myxococcales bacterium]